MYKNLQKVLVVEPNSDFRLLISSYLSPLEVIQASDANQAIAILKDQKIDMLICEFRLPNKSGVELLHWCRSHEIHVPIIFMSQELQLLKTEEVALADCCATLLQKPLNFKVLTAAVKAADEREHHKHCLHHYKGMVQTEILL
jgi:DNA-binding response OmpR family regulator